MVKTLFLDLFGVLLGIDQSVVIQKIATKVDSPYLTVKDIVMGEIFMRLERGEIAFKQYFQDLQYALPNGERLEYEWLKDIWLNSQVGELPLVNELPILQSTFNIWLISNTTNRHISHLKNQFPFLNKVNGIITSEEAGVRKPDHSIFQFAVYESKADSKTSYFIDDMWANVKSAQDFGFKAHRYTDFEECMNFLHSIQ
jgi:HAD superfamily hydrolase (TIGR01509 family)